MNADTESNSASTIRCEVLQHVARYRMSVLTVIQRLPTVGNLSRHRCRALLRDMCRDGELGVASLYGHVRYFHLPQPEPASAVRAKHNKHPSARHCGPLSEQAKVHNYAMLAFCCLSTRRRQRLTVDELQRHFPGIHRPGVTLNYYVDTSDDKPRLGFLRVDSGGRGRWDRVAAKCHNDLDTHCMDAAFEPFIRTGQFEITCVIALPQKALRLQEVIASWRDQRSSVIRIVALPELVHLIAPAPSRHF